MAQEIKVDRLYWRMPLGLVDITPGTDERGIIAGVSEIDLDRAIARFVRHGGKAYKGHCRLLDNGSINIFELVTE